MRINTSLILCAGYGKRLNPLTLKTPKPLLRLQNFTMLERCINLNLKLGIKKIFLNKYHLGNQIDKFLRDKNFPIEIEAVDDGKEILDTGGGILNMIKKSKDSNFLIFNPDTLWGENYISEIIEMQNFYFSKKLNNILLVTNKGLSFDKNFKGDFRLKDYNLKKNEPNDFIYIGCQILSKNLFTKYQIESFPISKIWNELLETNSLNGFQSLSNFFHLTDLETFKKLKDL